jgi:hypothetical protein
MRPYETVIRLEKQGVAQRKTQGVRSQFLASAIFIIYQKNWHQNPDALQKIDPILLQTRFAESLGDDAAAQNRSQVAREYYARVLERNPHDLLALAKVRDYARTFTGERFDPGEGKYKFERLRALLEDTSPEGQEIRKSAVWGILHIASLSVPAYSAVQQVITPVQDSFNKAIFDLFPDLKTLNDNFKTYFDAVLSHVRAQHQRVEDQFYRFRTLSYDSTHSLENECKAFSELRYTLLPDNPLDFGHDGRIFRWRNGLVSSLLQYFSASRPTEKERRYEQAKSQIELARQEIIRLVRK